MVYNEITIQLTIMQNQWEPCACFLATRWFHLGGDRRDTDTSSVLLMSSLVPNIAMVAALQKTLLHKDRMLEMEAGFFQCFCDNLMIFCLDFKPERMEL